MMRSKVDLPEPDCPRRATISPLARRKSTPSSTARALPSAERKDLPTALSSTIASDMSVLSCSEVHPVFGHLIEASPDEVVHAHDEDAHHRDAEGDAGKVADGRHVGDVAAESFGLQRRVAPG